MIEAHFTLLRLVRPLCLVLVLGLAALTAGCGGDDEGGYPPQVRENFLSNCVSSGGNEAQCSCAWDEITDTYSFEEFTQIEGRITAGSGGEELLPIIESCLDS